MPFKWYHVRIMNTKKIFCFLFWIIWENISCLNVRIKNISIYSHYNWWIFFAISWWHFIFQKCDFHTPSTLVFPFKVYWLYNHFAFIQVYVTIQAIYNKQSVLLIYAAKKPAYKAYKLQPINVMLHKKNQWNLKNAFTVMEFHLIMGEFIVSSCLAQNPSSATVKPHMQFNIQLTFLWLGD